MGKNNRHQKFLKKEKSKVKLKGKKKLTKGQNITDCSFKVKKIVTPSQLAPSAENEPKSTKNLSLKDLLSRTKHYSPNMRKDAVSGLKNLAYLHPETLQSSLCNLIEASAALCVDTESTVRKESLILLQYILEKVSTHQLESFMPILVSYLSVGMSHIHQEIQEDALRMLDLMLNSAPSLVARAVSVLLPIILDQISMRRNSGGVERTLSMNLQSSNTSITWRIKVLGRLHAILSVTESCRPESDKEDKPVKEVFWSDTENVHEPFYLYSLEKTCTIRGLFGPRSNTLPDNDNVFENKDETKKYISVLIPLLFDTWLEVELRKYQEQTGCQLSPEAAELLECVLEIMQLIWNYISREDLKTNSTELASWFQSKYKGMFLEHVMKRFPYSTTLEGGKSVKRRSKGQVPYEENRVRSCKSQNLAVCHMYCCLFTKPSKEQAQTVIAYTTDYMASGHLSSKQLILVLRCVLDQRKRQWEGVGVSTVPLAKAAVECYLRKQVEADCGNSPLFHLLCDLSISSTAEAFHNGVPESTYSKFVEHLPSILKQQEFSDKALKTVSHLALRLNPKLMQALRLHVPQIIENVAHVKVPGKDPRSVHTNIGCLLYQVSMWRLDIMDFVARHLQQHAASSTTNSDLCDYFKELLVIERQSHPTNAAAQKIRSMTWFI